MARILVTGGAGFIGANLSEKLLDAGHRVVCLDNFYSSSRSNIAHLEGRPGYEIVTGDVRAPIRIEVDEIYNLACPASPPRYQLDPVYTTETSVLGAINVLDLAHRVGARVVHASTSEVYGEPAVSPQPESYRGCVNSWGPRACYDEGKRCAEALFHDFRNRHGVDVRVARIFNTYGPRMDRRDGRVISNLVVQALTGEPLTIYGDGSQTRSFCYVDDLVNGLQRLMAGPTLATPLNLGNPTENTILEVAELVRSLIGGSLTLRFAPLPGDDPTQRCPDIGLARRHLGWSPEIPLREGLLRTIFYFRSHLSARSMPAMAFEAAE